MASIRRILIAIVGLLLIVDAAALAYVKLIGRGPTPSDELSKFVLWIDNKAQADKAAEVLKQRGYEPLVKPDQRKSPVETDFRVAMAGSKKILDPIAQTLRQSGHTQLSFSEDGEKLYYGGFYKQKSEAVRVAERIKSQEKMVFEVVPGVKMVSKKSHRVIVLEIPSNMIEPLMADISASNIEIDDYTETPLEPKESPEEE